MSDLTNIKGVGPATVAKLNELGINDLAGLSSQDDPAALAELVGGRGVTAEIVAGWIAQAKGADSDGTAASEPATNPEPFGGKGDHDGDGKVGGVAPALIPVSIKRDIWDKNGKRHRAGAVIELPVEAAMDAVESGAATRVK